MAKLTELCRAVIPSRRKTKTKERCLPLPRRLVAAMLAVVMLCLTLSSCSTLAVEFVEEGDFGETIMIQIEMENGGIIKLELYPEIAPITVENFVKLVKEGFYDGLIFHRVIKGFMIQGGDPTGTGMGGSGNRIKGEFAANGVQNTLSHTRGVISMARSAHKDSASSQFFICHANAPHLNGQYAAFGKVIEGMDVVDEIANIATDYSDRPMFDMVMKSVTVIED